MAFSTVLRRRRGMSPLMRLLLGLIAYRSLTRGKGRLAAMIGAGLGGRGGLGGLLAGGAGGAFLSSVLQHTINALHRNDPNRSLSPEALEAVLGEERIQWLMARTGLSRAALLAGLAGELRTHE